MSDWHSGTLLLGDYKVERPLGRGGMGEVFLVESRTTRNRFAVKRLAPETLGDERCRRGFLLELLAWVDLPLHPNITPCQFFRTAGDETVIFASYVDGGSLKEWISGRDGQAPRLYEGGPAKALERVLDIAIQFAWGLHATHKHQLVHQDVKPANVLMTQDGVPRVTDFGLTRARHTAARDFHEPSGSRGLVGSVDTVSSDPLASYAGKTPAYCSPEQESGQRLSTATDIWSWGVSLLEMFTGEVTWLGIAADEALELYLEAVRDSSQALRPQPPRMPASVADVLRKCLQTAPAARWGSLEEGAEALKNAYAREIGRPYGRAVPASRPASRPQKYDRWTRLGATWSDPRDWAQKALQAAGRDPAQADHLTLDWSGSRKARVVADLVGYESALKIYDEIGTGVEEERARFLLEKAAIHESLDDFAGARDIYHLEAERLQVMEATETRLMLASHLKKEGDVLCKLGEDRRAIESFDRAIETLERPSGDDVWREYDMLLADACLGKAESLMAYCSGASDSAHYKKLALELCMKTSDIWERLRDNLPDVDTANGDEAIATMLNNDWEIAKGFAKCYVHTANYVDGAAEFAALIEDAMRNYRALLELDPMTCLESRQSSIRVDFANCLLAFADRLSKSGDHERCLRFWKEALEIDEALVLEDGRVEFTENLALCYSNGASYFYSAERDEESLSYHDKALGLYERLVDWGDRLDLRGNMALASLNRAMLRYYTDSKKNAIADARQAVSILKEEESRTGRPDLKRGADAAQQILQNMLHG